MYIGGSFKNLKSLKSILKPKKNVLFFEVRFSHCCEFKVEHGFPNQSFSRPSFNHHHILPGVF